MDSTQEGKQVLDKAYEGLEQELPDRLTRMLRWLRSPQSRWVRIPLGVFFVLSSFAFFLPVIGIEFLPLGLLLLAQDIPFLRKPVGRGLLWLEDRWRAFKRRRRERKQA